MSVQKPSETKKFIQSHLYGGTDMKNDEIYSTYMSLVLTNSLDHLQNYTYLIKWLVYQNFRHLTFVNFNCPTNKYGQFLLHSQITRKLLTYCIEELLATTTCNNHNKFQIWSDYDISVFWDVPLCCLVAV